MRFNPEADINTKKDVSHIHSSRIWLNYAELSMTARAGGIKTE